MEDSIRANDVFFGQLISLIPADLYRHTASDPEVTQGMYYKHRKLPLQASEKKLLSQKNRLERYNKGLVKANSDEEAPPSSTT